MSPPASTPTAPLRITIVGGGICGLSAAIALRGPNRTITILEQSSFLGEVGAAISLQPNASKILSNHFHLPSPSPPAPPCPSITDHGFRIYSTTGALVSSIPSAPSSARYGAPRLVYHRRHLHALLLHAATTTTTTTTTNPFDDAPAHIRLSARAVAVDPASGTVSLADGTRVEADLVVAADGIRSALRIHVLGYDVPAVPTGLAAYRFMVPAQALRGTAFADKIDPAAPWTSMVMGWDRRIVMGPCRTVEGGRESGLFAVVALVPDSVVEEEGEGQGVRGSTWHTRGTVEGMLAAFEAFPEWCRSLFEAAEGEEVGLWQLRDLEPLERWHRGRVVLVGDAAHAMLPTQGQGASQSLEDAEALGAVFEGFVGREEVEQRLEEVVECRYDRATLIQAYSRQAAQPATNGKDSKVTMTTTEFMDYNCSYDGARDYQRKRMNGV